MRTRLWAAVAVALFIAYLLLHLPASDVFDGFARRFGFVLYDRTTRAVFAVAGVGLLLWLWTGGGSLQSALRRSLLALTVVIAVSMALVVNGIEAIHFPQYAILVVALASAGLRPETAWAVAVGLGALDELWQWLLLRRAVPEYFDWNDVVLNAIGAALGALAIQRATGLRTVPIWPRWVLGVAVAAGAAVALCIGPAVTQPFYRFTPAGRWYHLASPFEAALLVSAIWLAVRHALGAGASATRAAASTPVVADAVGDGPKPMSE